MSAAAGEAEAYETRVEAVRRILRRLDLSGAILTRPEHGLYLLGQWGGPILIGPTRLYRLDGREAPSWAESLPT